MYDAKYAHYQEKRWDQEQDQTREEWEKEQEQEREWEREQARNLQPDFDDEHVQNHDPDQDDDDDWITIVADDEEQEEQEGDVVHINCHEITGKPVFCMPVDATIDPCAICFENIDQMVNVVVNRCGHAFHASCMFEALEHGPGCPMCRCQLVQIIEYEDSDDEEATDYGDGSEHGSDEAEDEVEAADAPGPGPGAEDVGDEEHVGDVDEEDEEHEDDLQTRLKFHEDFVEHYKDMLNHYVGMLIHFQKNNKPEDVLRHQTIEIPKTVEDIKRHTEEVVKHKQLLATRA
jgi:hypothetical protein